MCKGQTLFVKVLESQSHCKTANKLDLTLPITVKRETKYYTSDKLY